VGLTIYPPVSSSSGLVRTATTIDLTVTTKQDILAAVPVGKQRVIDHIIARNPNYPINATPGTALYFGFDVDAFDLNADNTLLDFPTVDRRVLLSLSNPSIATAGVLGNAGDILGAILEDSTEVIPPMIVTGAEQFQVTVAGAGTATSNGVYPYFGFDGAKGYFQNPVTSSSIYWSGVASKWFIDDSPFGDISYESSDNVATPDLVTTWVAVNGAANPVPTVTASVASSILNQTYVYRTLQSSKPAYRYTDSAGFNYDIAWDGTWWSIDFDGNISWTSTEDVATPDLVTAWVLEGDAIIPPTIDPPIVTAGDNPTIVLDTFYYDIDT